MPIHDDFMGRILIQFCMAAAFAVISFFLFDSGAVFAALPDQFEAETIIKKGLQNPTHFTIAPDGRIFILEKTGTIKIWKQGELLPRPFASIPSSLETTLHDSSLALDPDFSKNKWLYVYYTDAAEFKDVLIRFSAIDDTAIEKPVRLYESSEAKRTNRTKKNIAFDTNGKPYITEQFSETKQSCPGELYTATMFPETYRNGCFMADFLKESIVFRTNDSLVDGKKQQKDFFSNAGTVVDLQSGPDGSLYFLTYNPGSLQRISYTHSDEQPDAFIQSSFLWGVEPLTVSFSSLGSTSRKGLPITYLWKFGDGTESTQASPIKTFTQKGIYTTQLTVTDASESSRTVSLPITVGQQPSVFIEKPFHGTSFSAGETLAFTIQAKDSERTDIQQAYITTDIIEHNSEGSALLASVSGSQFTFTFPEEISLSQTQRVEIKTTAEDKHGLRSTTAITLYPYRTYITVASQPYGLTLTINGNNINNSHSFESIVNQKHVITAPSPQILNGITYIFKGWDDGNTNATRTILAPESAVFTALYEQSEVNYYKGEYFSNPNLEGKPVVTRTEPSIAFDWGPGSPDPALPVNAFSARFSKMTQLDPGIYRFTTKTDDGVRLFVNGQKLIDDWNTHTVKKQSAEITLYGGMIPVVLEYFDLSDNAYAELEWQRIGSLPTQGWEASYFDNPNLSGKPVVVRYENELHIQSPMNAIDARIPEENTSAAFEKTFSLDQDADYSIHVHADDGIRIRVNDTLVFDKWNTSTENTSFTSRFQKGMNTITVEYVNKKGPASVRVWWEKKNETDTKDHPFTGYYYANKSLSGLPSLIRDDQEIKFNWKYAKVDASLPADAFSVRWKKDIYVPGGIYRFRVTADDGVRLFVDGKTYIDTWKTASRQKQSVEIPLTPGTHALTVEYFDTAGKASIDMSYEKISDIPSETFSAQYFQNTTLAGPVLSEKTYTTVDFDWGNQSPDVLLKPDQFSARFRKREFFQEGSYRFSVRADDGVRVYLNNTLLLDQWKDQPSTSYTFFTDIPTGVHELTIEYYEQTGNAMIAVNWQKMLSKKSAFQAEYYANAHLNGSPKLTRVDPEISFNWGAQAPASTLPNDAFSVRWTTKQFLEAGTYTFSASADDGIRILVDNAVILDQWNSPSDKQYSVDVPLSPGEKTIVVEYYDNSQEAHIQADWKKKADN